MQSSDSEFDVFTSDHGTEALLYHEINDDSDIDTFTCSSRISSQPRYTPTPPMSVTSSTSSLLSVFLPTSSFDVKPPQAAQCVMKRKYSGPTRAARRQPKRACGPQWSPSRLSNTTQALFKSLQPHKVHVIERSSSDYDGSDDNGMEERSRHSSSSTSITPQNRGSKQRFPQSSASTAPPPYTPNTPLHRQVYYKQAAQLLAKVRAAYAHNNDCTVYSEFVYLLCKYQRGEMRIKEVLSQVVELLVDRPELIVEFSYFLPAQYGAALSQVLEKVIKSGAAPLRTATPSSRIVSTQPQQPQPQQQPPPQQLTQPQQQQQQQQPPQTQQPRQQLLPKPIGQHNHGRRIETLLQSASIQETMNSALAFVETVRVTFIQQPGIYRSFLYIFHLYKKENTPVHELLQLVSGLFAQQPQLLLEFCDFLPLAAQEQARVAVRRMVRSGASSDGSGCTK